MLLATGAVLDAGLLEAVFGLAALASGDGWFSVTSCAGLIGFSSSKRTTSTFTGGADVPSALAAAGETAGSGREVPGGGEALARDGGAAGGDVETEDGLGAAATMGVGLVPGA